MRECTVNNEERKIQFWHLDNGLRKTPFQAAPVAFRLRKALYYKFETTATSTERPLDCTVLVQARCLLSQMQEENAKDTYNKLMCVLKTGSAANDPGLQSKRWSELLANHLVAGSALAQKLHEFRDASTANKGNRTTGAVRSKSLADLNKNNNSIDDLLRSNHRPKKNKDLGDPFWVKEKSGATKPDDGTKTDCGHELFPGCHPVVEGFTLLGLRERFKTRGNKKNNTKASKRVDAATTGILQTLNALKVPTQKNKKKARSVRAVPPKAKDGYVLVQLGLKGS